MIKQITLTVLLFSPLGLLPTSGLPFSLADERKMHGAPRPPVSADDEKLECKEHCASTEDAKLLFELTGRLSWYLDSPDQIKDAIAAVATLKINRFFEAIDARDLETISAMAHENPGIMFNIDDRMRCRNLLRSEVAQRLLSLYRDTLLFPNKILPNRHWAKIAGTAKSLSLNDRLKDRLFSQPDIQIDARSLAFGLTKDWSNRPICVHWKEGNTPLYEAVNNEELYAIDTITSTLNALKRVSMAGEAEIVEILLNAMVTKIDNMMDTQEVIHEVFPYHFYIMGALSGVLDCSTIARSSKKCQQAAAVLFKYHDLTTHPRDENYPVIAKMLVHAALHLAAAIEPLLDHGNNLALLFPLSARLQDRMSFAMGNGSSEIVQIIAEETARSPIGIDAKRGIINFEHVVSNTVNGKKLGILLSIDAHPLSLTNQFAMGMLSHIEKNPRLLARLQKYIRRYQKAYAHIGAHLLPVLTPIVAEYASHYIPAETAEYILALRPTINRDPGHINPPRNQPAENQDANNDQSLLGQHMASIMIQRPDEDQHD